MARLICLFLLSVQLVLAQRVRIVDTVRYADGTAVNGVLIVTLYKRMVTADGNYVAAGRAEHKIVNGAVDIWLEPNEASTPPGSYYLATFALDKGRYTERWVVPKTTQTLTIKDIVTADEPGVAPTYVPLDRLATDGALKGDIIAFGSGQWRRLSRGQDGDLLMADSSSDTGLRWGRPTEIGDVVWGGSNISTSGAGVYVSGQRTIGEAAFVNYSLVERAVALLASAANSSEQLKVSGKLRLSGAYWTGSGSAFVNADLLMVPLHTTQPNSQLDFSVAGARVVTMRRVGPPYANEPAHDLRVTGGTYSGTFYPPILTLSVDGSNEYADFTYDLQNADIDVSQGNLNLRPFSGNVNIWSPSWTAKLRVGSQNFTQALDIYHDGTKGVISSTTGGVSFANSVTVAQSLDASGTINSGSGFSYQGAAPSGQYLRGTGTVFVPSAIQDADLPNTVVRTSRTITAGTGLTGGGDLSQDRTISVLPDSTVQRVDVALNGTDVGSRRKINFVEGSWVNISAQDDVVNNRVNVTVEGAPPVMTVFGRTGAVTAQAGDYTASQITNQPSGNISATTVQAAINELDSEKAAVGHAHTLGGDVTGQLDSNTVTRIQGRNVSANAPSDGQVLMWSASSNQWQPAQVVSSVTSVFGRTGAVTAQTGDYSFSQISGTAAKSQLPGTTVHTDQSNTWTAGAQDWSAAAATLPMRVVSSLPSTCSVGEYVMLSSAPAGQNTYACTATNTWTLQGGAGGIGGSGTAGYIPLWSDSETIGDSSLSEQSDRIVSAKAVYAPEFVSTADPPQTVTLNAVGGGSVTLTPENTAYDNTVTLPAKNGTAVVLGTNETLSLSQGGTANASWTAGACVQVSSDGTKLESASGPCATSSQGWDPLDTTILVLRDDFCSGGASSGQIGELGWATSTIAGTAVATSLNAGSLTHPCELRGIGVSSTNANDGKSLYLYNPIGPFQNAASTGNWEAVFIWQFPSYSTDFRARIGLVKFDEPNVLVPTAFMGLRYDHDANWEPSGTKFIACVCNGNTKSNCTDVDTGVTVSSDTWYKLRVWSDSAGVIKMSINDGSVIVFNNPSTLPGSTVDFQPAWIVGRTGGTGNRQAYVDFFAARVTGISR